MMREPTPRTGLLVGPGGRNLPLVHDLLRWTQTPEIQRTGVKPRDWLQLWGTEYVDPREGSVPQVPDLGEFARFTSPYSSPERLEMFDVQRCRAELVPSELGLVYEMARIPAQNFATTVLERIVTTMPTVSALDDQGEPIFTWTSSTLDGQDPCLRLLEHPADGAGVLEWRWRVTARGLPWQGAPIAVYPVVAPWQVPGVDVVPPWDDMRRGSSRRWGDRQQTVVQGPMLVSLWLELRGLPDRWLVHAGGRLAGWSQSAGRMGAALRSATERIV